MMKLILDPDVHAAYVEVTTRPVATTKRLDQNRAIEYDENGDLVGIEFLAVHRGVALEELPFHEQLVRLFEGHDIRVYA